MTPDMAAVAQAMTSLRVAGDIAKALVGIRDGQILQTKVIELQAEILSAQQSAFAANTAQTDLLKRVSELEQVITNLKNWESNKNNYELKDTGSGAFVYALKQSVNTGEPLHWICTACYENGKKSILQASHKSDDGRYTLHCCPACPTKVQTRFMRSPESLAANERLELMGPGDPCPRCGQNEFRIERSEPDQTFGDLGGTRRYMKCDRCGLQEQNLINP